jgi:hypothetical protein
MNAPHCRFDTPAPAISREPRCDSARAAGWVGSSALDRAGGSACCNCANALECIGVACASGDPTISSGDVSATNVPRPVADDT